MVTSKASGISIVTVQRLSVLLLLLTENNIVLTSAFITPKTITHHSPGITSFRLHQTAPTVTDTTTTTSSTSPSVFSRRSFLSTSLILPLFTTLPPTATASSDTTITGVGTDLPSCLYYILRAREATEQETRLISTGKFKDVQRANVKLAVKFIIQNYRLSDNFLRAGSYLEGERQMKAGGVGQGAVQSLYTIMEYFDSADVQNLKVGTSDNMAGKEKLVLKGLEATRNQIDEFLSFFPTAEIASVKDMIKSENELNFKEFDKSLGSIVNPNPSQL